MRTFSLLLVSFFTLLLAYACTTQEECEALIGDYHYEVLLLDTLGLPQERRWADTYYQVAGDSLLTFVTNHCDKGKLKKEVWQWHPDRCTIEKLR